MTTIHLETKATEDFGIVSGESKPEHLHLWETKPLPNVEFTTNEDSLLDERLIAYGKFMIHPTNIFNTKTGEVRTEFFNIAQLYVFAFKEWSNLDTTCYPIYDIHNKYMGYIFNEKTHYLNPLKHEQYREFLREYIYPYIHIILIGFLWLYFIYTLIIK